MTAFVVTGTDTDIGKTVFAAGLTGYLDAHYWKPVQAGLDGQTDSQIVARLSGRPTLPEAYRLHLPASPHLAAEAEGLVIDPARLTPPPVRPLVIEGAGGLMVPLNRQTLFLSVIAGWGLPVILCARTALGTINHSLLSLMALRQAGAVIHGIAFIGDAVPAVEDTITQMGQVRRLGRLPRLATLDPATLRTAFAAAFADAGFTDTANPTGRP
jgi:dethiobiotin synthetase